MNYFRRYSIRCPSQKLGMVLVLVVMSSYALIWLLSPYFFNSRDPDLPKKPLWEWACSDDKCIKLLITDDTRATASGIGSCQLACMPFAGLWPIPTGIFYCDRSLASLNVYKIHFKYAKWYPELHDLISKATQRFNALILDGLPPKINRLSTGNNALQVLVNIKNQTIKRLTLDTNESYELSISTGRTGLLKATINSANFFGARHGLETLSQLILYDDVLEKAVIPSHVEISDSPQYAYRGLLLDTARNFFSIESIKRTIEGMAMSKLNTFHWHITDSQSFAYYSKSQPKLSHIGAFSRDKIYTRASVAEILEFAKYRGVRVMPEFDAPGHVGEGWQDTEFLACFNQRPWGAYCREPPCGQFDPTVPDLYDTLEDIYGDMFDQFNPDIFHMGGDEVSLNCWNSSDNIVTWMKVVKKWGRSEKDFMKLWNVFQSEALKRLTKKSLLKIPVIIWSSTLTLKRYVKQYIHKDRYIIQVWTARDDSVIYDLLEMGYRLIMSNSDALYLDCGYGGWVSSGNNWCSPYKGWQKIYDNSFDNYPGKLSEQIIGAEATMWSEQVDDLTLDSKTWPRTSALAERLWSNPNTSWMEADSRIQLHRERLVRRGIKAENLAPHWCYQNQDQCIN